MSLKRIILHWSAGGNTPSSVDREHYHFVVGGDGTVVRGVHTPEDNIITTDQIYGAHTRLLNTGSIGVAAAGMLGAVARTTWARRDDGPWVDLEQGIWWRSGENEIETVKKRRPHGIPPRLAAHLQRWKRIHGGTYIAETARDPGQPVWDIGKALEGAAARAGVKRITPHTLKHTAITLFIQSGGSAEDASDYFSTSIETIQSNYWHHSPAHQVRAVAHMANLGRKPA